MDRACVEIKTVVTTANSVLRGGADSFESVDLNGTISLIDAAKAAGVQHFIYTSGSDTDPDHPNPLISAKGKCEAYLKESGLTYTILKPGMFMEAWIGVVVGVPLRAGKPVTLVGEGRRKQVFVSMADVATYAVCAVDNPSAKNQEILIAGPASYSWKEVCEAVGRAMGQDLNIHYVSPGDPIPFVPKFMREALVEMEMADSYIEMRHTVNAYGIEPTTLDAFAQQFFCASP